jgi:hypothetical protein
MSSGMMHDYDIRSVMSSSRRVKSVAMAVGGVEVCVHYTSKIRVVKSAAKSVEKVCVCVSMRDIKALNRRRAELNKSPLLSVGVDVNV